MTTTPVPSPVAFIANGSGASVLDQLLAVRGIGIVVDRDSYPAMGPYIVKIGDTPWSPGWLCRILRQDGPPHYTVTSVAPEVSLAYVTPLKGDVVVLFPAADFSTTEG